jgi:hypothetical protein
VRGTGNLNNTIRYFAGALVILGLCTGPRAHRARWVLVILTFGHLLHDALFSFIGHVIPRLRLAAVSSVGAARRGAIFDRLFFDAMESAIVLVGDRG